MANRITIQPSTNGQTTKTRKPATRKPTTPKTDDLTTWSHVGVITTATLSAVLNGYANAQTATIPALGAAIGITIPWIVFVLCKVGSKQYRQNNRNRSYFTAFAAGCLLLLSIDHCSTSIALLTLGHAVANWQTYSMAIAIDLGLVACELATVKIK